jgi:predicted TIM-barrel fold metal-dependent hydrolase
MQNAFNVARSFMQRRNFLELVLGFGAGSVLSGSLSAQTTGPRRIDVHQHYVSPDYVGLLVRKNANINQWKDYTPARNIDAMDKAGVATGMVSPTAPGVWFGDRNEARSAAREINEYAAGKMVAQYKGRFGLFASLPFPDVDGCLREIEYAFDTLKADGVGLLTSYDKMWLGDKTFAPIFDELNRRNAVVYTHPTEAACCPNLVDGVGVTTLEYPTDTTRTIMNLIVGGTATRCPNIKFIFSHTGGTLVSVAGRFLGDAASAANLARAPEVNSRLYHIRRFYYDTAGSANPIQIQSLKLLVPASQIVFGTDFPIRSPEDTVAGLETSGLSAQELRGVYRENAVKFLPKFV